MTSSTIPIVSALVATLEPILFEQEACTLVEGPESLPTEGQEITDPSEALDAPALPIDTVDAAVGQGLEITVDFIDNTLEETIQSLGYESRFQGLRCLLQEMVTLTRGHAAKLRILVWPYWHVAYHSHPSGRRTCPANQPTKPRTSTPSTSPA